MVEESFWSRTFYCGQGNGSPTKDLKLIVFFLNRWEAPNLFNLTRTSSFQKRKRISVRLRWRLPGVAAAVVIIIIIIIIPAVAAAFKSEHLNSKTMMKRTVSISGKIFFFWCYRLRKNSKLRRTWKLMADATWHQHQISAHFLWQIWWQKSTSRNHVTMNVSVQAETRAFRVEIFCQTACSYHV